MYEIKLQTVRSQADPGLFYFSSIIFKNITVLLKKATLQKKML